MTKTLETPRLTLVQYTRDMITDEHIAWLNDDEVVRYSEQRHNRHTLGSQAIYLRSFGKHEHIWLIRHRFPPGTDIGTITAGVDRANRVADMGILVGAKSEWRKGFGTEAWQAVMEYLFGLDNYKCYKIEAGCMRTNHAMIRLAMRCDMVLEGAREGHFLVDGKRIDLLQFARFYHDGEG